jgi:hypothetical protein
MGWNSWNLAGCAINETFFRATVESLAAKGFLERGYEYINLVKIRWRLRLAAAAAAAAVSPIRSRSGCLMAGRLLDGHGA